ncbi:MAG: sensor histidine kinase [Microthrixaceae bacterium]
MIVAVVVLVVALAVVGSVAVAARRQADAATLRADTAERLLGHAADGAPTTPVLRAPEPAVGVGVTGPSPDDTTAGGEPDGADVATGAEPGDELLYRLRHAVDRLEHGIVVWDATGTELFRNEAARSLASARDGRVLVAAAVEELLTEAVTGRTVRRAVELFGPPAESFVVTAYPFSDGRADGALAVVEDRSLQRRTETVRRDFVANISHELKTPIGALGLLAETIRDEPDREVVERLASRMILEAERVGRTVDDLLELSRIEFGDDTEFEHITVLSVVAEAEGRLASAAEQAGIAVRLEVPASVEIDGDRRQLVSALYNLLDNAVKYSPEGSEVLVVAEEDPAGGLVRLAVADHGIGVPRRDLDRIFERFYRVDRARSRETGGTGLGLAIVRHVASNHGGDVAVDSTEGVGTTFTLTLPRPDARRFPRPGADEPRQIPVPVPSEAERP